MFQFSLKKYSVKYTSYTTRTWSIVDLLYSYKQVYLMKYTATVLLFAKGSQTH